MEPANNKPRSNELRIGLTGGIASGKSTVATMFAEHGVPIIDTDVIARQVVAPGQPGLAAVTDRFGTELLKPDGYIDRHQLRNLVFADEGQRHALEAILHPLIRARVIELASLAGGPYQLLVIPLLVETGFDSLVDRVLVVDCPKSLQRTRLLTRDAETPERIELILAAQIDRHERLAAADEIIDNAGTPEQTRARVAALHAQYVRLA